MIFQQTTQVPNVLFDNYLPLLTESELKILLVVIRQTNGWIDKRTGRRKTRDRISHSQFISKTGLSRRVISKTLKSLIEKGLISVSDFTGNLLHQTQERKGKSFMLYKSTLQPLCTKTKPQSKRTNAVKHISEVLRSSGYQLDKADD